MSSRYQLPKVIGGIISKPTAVSRIYSGSYRLRSHRTVLPVISGYTVASPYGRSI